MKYKEYSQIATTIEQSKRMIDVGFPVETADMWWTTVQPLRFDGYKTIPDGDPYTSLSLYKMEHICIASYDETPAWSLSRLIDILGSEVFYNYIFRGYDTNCSPIESEDVIERLVWYIESIWRRINEHEKQREKEEEFCRTTCKGYQESGGFCYVDGRCEAFRNHFSKIV